MTWQHGALGRAGDADFFAAVSEQRLESVTCSSPRNSQLGPGAGTGAGFVPAQAVFGGLSMDSAGTRSAGALRKGVCCAQDLLLLLLQSQTCGCTHSLPDQPWGDWAVTAGRTPTQPLCP